MINAVFVARNDDVWLKVVSEIVIASVPRKSKFVELNELLSKANEIIDLYKKAGTHREKQSLADEYYAICDRIRILRRQIEAKEVLALINRAIKIASALLQRSNNFIRNLRLFYRRIIRFLFKNMDDNSGDVVFQLQVLKNNYITTNYFLNEPIQKFTLLNR